MPRSNGVLPLRPVTLRTGTAAFLAVLCLSAVWAGEGDPPTVPDLRVKAGGTFEVPTTSEPFEIDGRLDEPGWSDALSLPIAYEVRPGENVAAPVETEVLLTHDATYIYAAFRAHDPDPTKIRAHLRDRDSLGNDDWVDLVLDTFDDERRAYDFMCNPFGVQMDAVETRDDFDPSWDTFWSSAGRITEWGYVVEMRIPFSSLRFQHTDGPQTWGLDAVRSYPRNVRHHLGLFPRARDNNCYLCQTVKLSGFAGALPSRNLEITPTVVASRTDTRQELPSGLLETGDVELDAGVTGQWGVTPNMTLAGTLNPDFSQVEADTRQLDVNETFALFYPEKRPFFLEGADYFDTIMNVVHTRTIRDPSWGLKLTAKNNGNTAGAYVVRDDVTNILIPGSQGSRRTSLDQPSTAAVLRYGRDVGRRVTLGALATVREADGYGNQVLGLDGEVWLSDGDRLVWQLLGSSTEYPDRVVEELSQPEDELHDWAAELEYVHDTRNVDLWGGYRRIGKDFRADLGFLPQVDAALTYIGAEYEWIPDGRSWFSSIEAGVQAARKNTTNGDLLRDKVDIFASYGGPLQSTLSATASGWREGYEGNEFDGGTLSASASIRPTADSKVSLSIATGDAVDYANVRAGERVRLRGRLALDLGTRLKLNVDHLHEALDVEGGTLYTAEITQATVAYHFTRSSFLRAMLQHTDTDANTDLYSDDRNAAERELFAQVLFAYELNPRTVLYVGSTNDSFGTQAYDPVTTNRTFFLKLGYAFRP